MEAYENQSQDNLINKETLVEKESPPSASLNAPNLNFDSIKAITNDEFLQKRLSKMQIIEAREGQKTEQKEGKDQCPRCEQWLKQESIASHTAQHSSQILDFLFLGSAQNSSNFKVTARLQFKLILGLKPLQNELTGKIQISYILNAATELNNIFPKFFVYKKLDLEDVLDEKITPFFQECIKFIEKARKEEKNILVHCIQGISRSVTIVLAYLMFKGMTLKASYDLVRQKRPVSRPNVQFVKELLAYEFSLYNSNSCTGCYINPLY